MLKFQGNWSEELVKDLILSHTNRSHRETAEHLSKKHNLLFTRDSVKNKFVSLGGKVTPEQVEPVRSRDYFDIPVSDEGKSGKRIYVVTSAIAGCALNEGFFKSIKTYCAARKAKLVILPMRGMASKQEEFSKEVLDKIEPYIYTEYTFNSNLEAFDIGLSPTAVNPLTGLSRLAQKKASLIVASPKQNMDTIATANTTTPHILQSTGSLSEPSYPKNRIGVLSKESHIVGGIVVEIEDDEIFHIRQIQADKKDGSFYDLNFKYLPNRKEKAKALAMVWGDLHSGSEDASAVRAWYELMDLTEPKNVFLHDTFDGRSISHHEEHNMTAKVNRKYPYTSLEEELQYLISLLTEMENKYQDTTFYSVASNHDEHLSRYLNESRFVYDPKNYRISLELAIYLCDGLNPIEQYIKNHSENTLFTKWLKRDDDVKLAGNILSIHGDAGPGGSRGNVTTNEKTYRKSVIGHSHTPRILNKTIQVGTSTKLRLSYNIGQPSSWLHASALVYPNGTKTLIVSVAGKWKV